MRPFSEAERLRLAIRLRFTNAVGCWVAANPVMPFRNRTSDESSRDYQEHIARNAPDAVLRKAVKESRNL